jgi:hypothetical protein
VLQIDSKRHEPRVPFGSLLDRGLIEPGELMFDARGVGMPKCVQMACSSQMKLEGQFTLWAQLFREPKLAMVGLFGMWIEKVTLFQ